MTPSPCCQADAGHDETLDLLGALLDLSDTVASFPILLLSPLRTRPRPLQDDPRATNLLVATTVGSAELPAALTASPSRRRSLDSF